MSKIAVIETGGKQYKVAEGQTIKIEKLEENTGDKVTFDKVLLIAEEDGKNVNIGEPHIDGASVEGEVIDEGRDRKVMVIKYKRKTRYRRRQGHRQAYTKVKISKIA